MKGSCFSFRPSKRGVSDAGKVLRAHHMVHHIYDWLDSPRHACIHLLYQVYCAGEAGDSVAKSSKTFCLLGLVLNEGPDASKVLSRCMDLVL